MRETQPLKDMSRYDKIVAGLLILKHYGEQICAQHDVIYAGGADLWTVSPEDAASLEALGWHIDKSCNSYARFT